MQDGQPNQPPNQPAPSPAPTPPAPVMPAVPSAAPVEAEPAKTIPPKAKQVWFKRAWTWSLTHKKIALPILVLIFLGIILAVPWSRYQAAGLVLKRDVTVRVVDLATGKPVSGATVSSGSTSSSTDSNGEAKLKLKDGWRNLQVNLNYYQSGSAKILVPILSPRTEPVISLVATGRQANVTVDDLISGDALAGVSVKVAGITATTDKSGDALLVLPAGQTSQKATLSLSGYNDASVTVQVSNSAVKLNTFNLTPAGRVYYLSDASAQLNVMSANFDGTDAKVVLAGNGHEDINTSQLMVSADSKFLALLTSRTTDTNPQLYIIDISTNQTSEADYGNAEFTLYGWLGDKLIYTTQSNSIHTWQAGRNKLKCYDATSGQLTLLNQSSATGDSSAAADEQYDAVFLMHAQGSVAYAKTWQVDYGLSGKPSLSTKQNTFNQIKADGTDASVVDQFGATDIVFYNQYSPSTIYIDRVTGGSSNHYYTWTAGGGSPTALSLSSASFAKNYPSYYESPTSQNAIWSQASDQAWSNFIGDGSGGNAKQIGGSQDISPQAAFGWIDANHTITHIPNGCNLEVVSTSGKDAGVVAVKNCLASDTYNGE